MNTDAPAGKIRVAIVDDQKEFRHGLAFLVNASHGLTCVAECANYEDAIESIPPAKPNVILLDIDLGQDKSGLDCIRPLKKAIPGVSVIMLTVMEQPLLVFTALSLGAGGYISKSTPLGQLPRVINEAFQGGAPVSADFGEIGHAFREVFGQPFRANPDSTRSGATLWAKLVIKCPN